MKLLLKLYLRLKEVRLIKKRIYVFVANKGEEKLYREKMDLDTYYKIVVGKKGLVPQRRYISQYFPEGTKIVSMDVDVQNMIQLKRDDITFTTKFRPDGTPEISLKSKPDI